MTDHGPKASRNTDHRPEDGGSKELSVYEEVTGQVTPERIAEIRARTLAERPELAGPKRARRVGAPVTGRTVIVNAEQALEIPGARAAAALEADAAANLAHDEEDENAGLTAAEIFERMRERLAKQRESDPYRSVKMDSNDILSVRPYRAEPTDKQT